MVYSFFDTDPSMDARSLGTFIILDHIERARKRGLPYLYLGYLVEGSPEDELQGALPTARASHAERLAGE
jgi:arginyl-tRNA--protein-N-Asp/Glu arginylyltransferase